MALPVLLAHHAAARPGVRNNLNARRSEARCMQGSSPGERGAPAGGRLDEIRRDLTRSLLLPFALVMAVAAIEGFWSSAGLGQPFALAVLVVAAVVLPVTMARSTRRIVARIRSLDEE